MKPQQIRVKVIKKTEIADNYWSVWLERAGIEYEAGQYASIKVNVAGERRSYSLGSFPAERTLGIVADITPMGKGSRFILDLVVGSEAELLVPLGQFMVTPEQRAVETKGFLLVGTGSGIVPLRSMIFDLLKVKKETRPVQLHWGMRYEKDLFWAEDFRNLEKDFSNFKADIVLSKPSESWRFCVGHVGDCLIGHKMDFAGWQTYLCGNKEMIGEISVLLQNHGVDPKAVHFEKFN